MTAKTAKAPTKKTKTTKSAKTSKPKTVIAAAKPAKSEAPIKTVGKKVDEKRSLWLLNLRLGVILLILAVAVVVVGNSTAVPVTMQYLVRDGLASEVAGHEVAAPAVRHMWDVQVSWIVAKVLAIFGIVYLLAATLLRKRYEVWLDNGINILRWVGFGLGGGVAMVAVAALSGVSDVSTLTLVLGSVIVASILALSVELLGSGRRLRKLLGIGAILAVFCPWLVLARSAAGVVIYDGTMPAYLYYVYAVVTLLVVAVGLALYMRTKRRGRWASTFYAERMFIFLGFLASVVLALQIFSGALQP
jgi:hypothetical protein